MILAVQNLRCGHDFDGQTTFVPAMALLRLNFNLEK